MTSFLTKWSRMTAGPSPSSKWHRTASRIYSRSVCFREDGHTRGCGCVSSLVGVLDNEYQFFGRRPTQLARHIPILAILLRSLQLARCVTPGESVALSAVTMAIGLLVSYPSMMSRVYDEIVDFIASGTDPQAAAAFVPSPETKERVAELLHREKTTQLSEEESSELGHYLHIEHIMRLAKARARQHLAE